MQNLAPRHWLHLAALIGALGVAVRPAAAVNCGDPTPTTCGAGNVAGCIAGPNRGVSDADLANIQHIVVMMQENRSFDHYFGQLHDEGQPDSEAVPADASNPNPLNPSGPPITRFHKTQNCEVADLDHSWNGTHKEWNGGAMDGFTAANAVAKDPSGSRTMGYYDSGDLPFYYDIARTFAISRASSSVTLGRAERSSDSSSSFPRSRRRSRRARGSCTWTRAVPSSVMRRIGWPQGSSGSPVPAIQPPSGQASAQSGLCQRTARFLGSSP